MERKDTCFVTCRCGCCDTILATKSFGQVYLSFLSSDFYTKQYCFEKLRLTAKLILGRKIVKEVLCNKDDLVALRDFLVSAEYEEDEPEDNDSHIRISWDKDFGYSIYLIADIKRWKALKMKNHRLFDIVLTEADRGRLVKRINTLLKKHEKTSQKTNYIALAAAGSSEG